MKTKEKQQVQRFCWVISPFLHKKIKNHVDSIKKNSNTIISRQHWLESAIKDKLKKQETSSHPDERIQIYLDHLTFLRLNHRVKQIREKLGEYSKQQLFIEAILEKLHREEETTKRKIAENIQLLNELRNVPK